MVVLADVPIASAHWGEIIAIGLRYEVVLLDAITRIRTSVLCGHRGLILSLAFSQDGTLLMSGSVDMTVGVWDVQTSGVIRTFYHYPFANFAPSISPDGTTVALGTNDGRVRLWDVRTGKCNSIKMDDGKVKIIEFSPINSRHFISLSGGIMRQ